ncbi:MAG TPA: substrate-binding domain-containing protein, partial [Candidatus Eremiobacteraceae bacterium]|nr:substrate-binding domain-containing protein [Candidatus Eremiobacteraceae bacterium]
NARPNTATNVYGGGSTLASLLYRQWMDYYGVAMPPDPQGAPNGLPVNANFQYYYAGIGSGAGRAAFISQVPSTTVPQSDPIYCPGGVTTCYPYPLWHYSGSDATLSSTEISCYQSGCPPTYPNAAQPERGQYVQIPTLSTDITFFYNPSGQTIGANGLRLRRSTYCGIWEGAITNWGDPAITADNGGVQVSTQPIVRVVRADSSGTTFLTTNHLNTACVNLPNSADDWTGGVGGTVTWPNGAVQSGTGSSGVVSVVQSTAGAIGYVGPSFVAPIVSGGLPTASLQNNYYYNRGNSGHYITQSIKSTLASFVGVAPPSNPDPFDLGILVPDPIEKGAYPVVGYTWLLAYQCYNLSSEAQGMQGIINWYAQSGRTGTTPPDIILAQQGLAPLNATWKKAVRGISKHIVQGPVAGVCTI